MSFWILSPRGAGNTCCSCKPLVTTPCSCPAPTLVCDSISASLTKCGFDEFGTPSSPPKRYLVKTQAGAITDTYDPAGPNEQTNIVTWSGSITYARPACTTTDTRALSIRSIVGSNVGGPCDATKNASGPSVRMDEAGDGSTPDPRGCYFWGTNCAGTTMDLLQGCCSSATATSTTVDTFVTTSCSSYVGGSVSGTDATLTLSSEYTTADLISDTVAALPAYPGTYAGTCSSYRDLSSDEITYTIRRFKYKFTLPTLTGIVSYRIDWNEGATAKYYEWNGTDTETPVYGPVDEPASNGTVAITDIVATCS